MKRTQKEIDQQIEGLLQMRTTIPRTNIFGDDNYGPIDAQISILRGEKTYKDYEDDQIDIESAAYEVNEWLNADEVTDNDNLYE